MFHNCAGLGTREATRARIVIVGTILAIALTIASSSMALGASPTSIGIPAASNVQQTIQAMLAGRAQHLVSGKSQQAANYSIPGSAPLARAEASANLVLDARREKLRSAGEEYTGSNTRVQISNTSVVGTVMTVTAKEETELIYKKVHGDEPPSTSYVVEHVFRFDHLDSGWTLTSDQALATGGLAPVTEVAVEVPTSAPVADPSAASTDRPVGPLSASDKVLRSTATPVSGMSPMSIPSGLNYSNMVNYAFAHWGGSGAPYNGDYRSWGSEDCTNFISQALRAGGWQDAGGLWFDNGSWWYNFLNQTHTWINAQAWSMFAPSRTNSLGNVWDLRYADVMQMDFGRDGTKDHTMLVTVWNSSQIYLTYHSIDTKNRSLSSILTQYPSAWYYAYRT